jgi:hypothetical protein
MADAVILFWLDWCICEEEFAHLMAGLGKRGRGEIVVCVLRRGVVP